jgi:hypothetical protein
VPGRWATSSPRGAPNPAATADHRAAITSIVDRMREMPDGQRQALVKYALDGLDYLAAQGSVEAGLSATGARILTRGAVAAGVAASAIGAAPAQPVRKVAHPTRAGAVARPHPVSRVVLATAEADARTGPGPADSG